MMLKNLMACALLLPAASTISWSDSLSAGGPVPSPNVALARYVSAAEQTPGWGATAVDIEASIPKLGKQGRLRAIRRLLAPGKIVYQVLGIEGDSTVKTQVIARYLSAEVQAARKPAAAVAITPENYRFHYAGAVRDAADVSYVFQIKPRKKRQGLIKGQLWIDAFSGMAVRQAGRLVRSPSVFLRRVEITRDTDIQNGEAYERVTHVTIDARLIGRAELTITERPCEAGQGIGVLSQNGGQAACPADSAAPDLTAVN